MYFADLSVFDGVRVRERHGVLVEDGRIAWVGLHSRAPRAAKGAEERWGEFLMPGLIDSHVHLGFDGSGDFEAEARELTPALAAIKGVRNAARQLASGVTTVRDLGGLGTVELARSIDRGIVPGPRVVAAGLALTITGGHGHNIGIAREVDGAEGMRRAVREEIRAGAAVIKLIATGGVLTPGIGATFTAFTPEELQAAVDEAHSWDRPVAAHAIGTDGILAAIRAGVDSIEHCNLATAEVVREMKVRGTFRSATLCAPRRIVEHRDEVPAYAVEKATALLEETKVAHARAVKAGVRHVCGTDAGTPFNPHGSAPRELAYMVEWGTAPIDALRAATSNGAELLRLDGVGRIEPGAHADLALYGANAADDIGTLSMPRLVLKAGEVVASR